MLTKAEPQTSGRWGRLGFRRLAAPPPPGGPLPLVAGFLDQGAVEGVQAGWLLNFVIFGRNGALLGPLGLPAPPRPGGAPAPGGWIPGPGGHRGSPGRLVAQFRDFWASRPKGLPAPLPLVAGFLDQGAVEGVQAGWLLNFVIFGAVITPVRLLRLMFRAAEQGKKPWPEQGRDAFRPQ